MVSIVEGVGVRVGVGVGVGVGVEVDVDGRDSAGRRIRCLTSEVGGQISEVRGQRSERR